MQCICNCFYIWKTKRPFHKRINDRISLKKRRMETPMSCHVGLFHGFSLDTIKLMALEHIPPDGRGGSNDQKLLQLESRWIYLLSTNLFCSILSICPWLLVPAVSFFPSFSPPLFFPPSTPFLSSPSPHFLVFVIPMVINNLPLTIHPP